MSIGFASNSSVKQAGRGATLGTATSSFVGVVRVDATTLQVDATGTISVNLTPGVVTPGRATSSTFGIVRADGTSVLITSGVISIQAFYTGMIMMWSGNIATIPSGWVLCDGTNGTPDLRNRFVVGAGSIYNPADTGGTSDAIVVSHSHTITDPGHFHYWGGGGNAQVGNDNGGANANGGSSAFATSTAYTGINGTNTTGQSGTNQNLPPYYALAYIMKT
jgi:hypothetical protein